MGMSRGLGKLKSAIKKIERENKKRAKELEKEAKKKGERVLQKIGERC